MYIHVHEFMSLYVHVTDMYIDIDIYWTRPGGNSGHQGCPAVLHLSLSTTKTCWDNCLYYVHTLYIQCSYMVHTLMYYVHVHWLFNACTTEAISTVNSPVTTGNWPVTLHDSYIQCLSTGISQSVYTLFGTVCHDQEWQCPYGQLSCDFSSKLRLNASVSSWTVLNTAERCLDTKKGKWHRKADHMP